MLIGGCFVNPLYNKLEHGSDPYDTRDESAIDTIVIHHVGAAERDYTAQELATYHVRSRGWPGIGYHFVIHPDGRIEQTNKLTSVSWHAGRWNTRSIGIVLAGTFTNSPPTAPCRSRCRQLIGALRIHLGRSLAYLAHRDLDNTGYGPTECPGATWPSWRDSLNPLPRHVAVK